MNGENLISAFKRVRLRFRSQYGTGGIGDDTEDALQEAFCRVWTHRSEIVDSSHAEGLLVKASRNVRIDQERRRQAHPESSIEDVGECSHDDAADDSVAETYRKIDRLASDALSDRDRRILYLREKNGWDFEELSEYFGLTESNVRMIVSRSRKTLRSLYIKNRDENG